jgi:O-antigen/teichoic acid export membrane protein
METGRLSGDQQQDRDLAEASDAMAVVPLGAPGEQDVLETSAAGRMVLRGGTLRVLGYLTSILVSVLGAALMLRHLGRVGFGRYATALAITTIIGSLSDLGLTGVGLRQAAAGRREDREGIIRNVLGMRLSISTIGIALGCAFGIAVGYPTVMIEGVAVAGIGLLLLVTFDSYSMLLQLELRLGWTAVLELLRQVLQTVVIVLLVLAGATLLPFIGSQLPGSLAVAIAAALLVRAGLRLAPSFNVREWAKLGRTLLPFAAASAIGAVYFRVEIVILSLVAASGQTGLFGAAFRITEVVVGIPWLVAASALPLISRAAEHDRERLAYALGRLFEASLIAGVGLAVIVFLGARFGIEVVGGAQYHGSIEVLRVQAATVAFTFFVTQWGFALLALKRTRALLTVNALAMLTAVAVTLVLAPIDGATGASIALVVAEAVLATGYASALRRDDPRLGVQLRAIPRTLLAAAVAIGVATVTGVPSVVAAIIGAIVYVLVLAITGGLPPELWELVPRRGGSAA